MVIHKPISYKFNLLRSLLYHRESHLSAGSFSGWLSDTRTQSSSPSYRSPSWILSWASTKRYRFTRASAPPVRTFRFGPLSNLSSFDFNSDLSRPLQTSQLKARPVTTFNRADSPRSSRRDHKRRTLMALNLNSLISDRPTLNNQNSINREQDKTDARKYLLLF